jgi:hypothetical protein
MKLIITLSLLSLTTVSYANCTNAYQVYSVKEDNEGQKKGKRVISSGLASLGSGAGVYTTGYLLQGYFGTEAAYMTSSYFGGTVTTSPIITSVGTITYLMATEYFKVQKTLKQSRYGFGAELDSLKEDIEDELGAEVSKNDLRNSIIELNESRNICDKKLLNYEEFKAKVIKNLK